MAPLQRSLHPSDQGDFPAWLLNTDLTALRLGVIGLGGLGGSGKVAFELAQNLARLGASVSMLTGSASLWSGERHRRLRYTPVPVPRTPTAPHPHWVEPLGWAIAAHGLAADIQVLSIHYGVGLLEAALLAQRYLAARGRALRLCLTLHGTDVTQFGRDPSYGPRLRRLVARCDAVTTVSHWLADQAVAILKLPKRPLVVHNAVDIKLFHPHHGRVDNPSHPFTLCHVSNFRPIKQPLDAVAVLAKLREIDPTVQLIMVGEGPLLERTKAYGKALGVEQGLRFTGKLTPEALRRQLDVSDALLVTSASESFCLSALEAMACGLPVVGTRCGGLEEVITALDGGLAEMLLAPVGDIAGLAEQALRLKDDPALRHRLGSRCLDTVHQRFTLARQLRGYSDILLALQPEVSP